MNTKNNNLWNLCILLIVFVTATALLAHAVWKQAYKQETTPIESISEIESETEDILPPPLPEGEQALPETDAPLTEEEKEIKRKQQILSAVFSAEDSQRLSRVFTEIKNQPIIDDQGKTMPDFVSFPIKVIKARVEERRQIMETARQHNIDTQSPQWKEMMQQLYPNDSEESASQVAETHMQDKAEKLL